MTKNLWADKPISEATFYILLALIDPLHGYGVMKKVDALSQGTVSIGPGTLYGTLSKLVRAKLIYKKAEDDRRKTYALTETGKAYLLSLIDRLSIMSQNGLQAAKSLQV